MTPKKALIVWGGWEGHTPRESAELFAEVLRRNGFEVEVSNTLDAFLGLEKMAGLRLIVPIWTMGTITPDQERGLLEAVRSGVGLAGFHGGMCDTFRDNPEYQWMTGGQFVAHPGDLLPSYRVRITDPDHPITQGLGDFDLRNTEQYWMHTDPSNRVLATTEFERPVRCVMPCVWTRTWGKGRVFFASWGHTVKDFDVPEARTIVERGMLWASGGGSESPGDHGSR